MSVVDQESLRSLVGKFCDNTAVIGIVGLGYVGLPLMLRYSEVGYKVLGFDVDNDKVSRLNCGKSYIEHISDSAIADACNQGFVATTDFALIAEADALIICVPTPLNSYREPDLSFVTNTVDALLPHLRKGQVVSLESTTYPGTTDEELKPRIETTGLTVGIDVFLVYSPEREDPGNADFITKTIPKICGGVTEACREAGLALYQGVIDRVVLVSSTRVAEMTKLLENIHRAVNIGLVNEMKIVADRMGIDIYEVIDAAASKPFGFVPYYPGPGLGGHCIPIDPFYLTWKAREFGIHTRFIELAGEVNSFMPEWVVNKVATALNCESKSIRGSNILMLGIAYKKNVDDMRESPALSIMAILREQGARLTYHDPHVPRFPPLRKYAFDLSCIELNIETIKQSDCIIIATDHDAVDYELVRQHAHLIVDTRGVYREREKHIVKA